MDSNFVHGVITPIITPIDAEEKVIDKSLREIIDHIIKGGVHGILSMGSNGEFFGFSSAELERAVSITVDQSQGRVPVYMGIGAISTKECVRLAKKAEELKADAITILPPMFLSPNDEELYQHFKSVAEAVSLPVLLYNNPDRMRIGISENLLVRLAEIPNIVGAKDSSGDMTLTAEFIRLTRDKSFKIMAGRDMMILATLNYGGVGCVASTSNIVPKLVVDIYDKFMAGDFSGALEAQFKLAPLRMAYDLGSFPVVTKDYMKLLGFNVGQPVKPNTGCSPANMKKLKSILDDIGAEKLT